MPIETIEIERKGRELVELTLNVPGQPNVVRVGEAELNLDRVVRLELTQASLRIERHIVPGGPPAGDDQNARP